jgi:AhpC/TSA antioxidant enzyme
VNEFRELGCEVAAISMSRPDALPHYLARSPMPFPVFADPDRTAYAAFGLGRTTWARLLRPSIVWKYTRSILRGAKVRRIPEGEDALQLGGDFLVDRDRRLVWAHRGADPMDRPAVEEILRAVREHIAIARGG